MSREIIIILSSDESDSETVPISKPGLSSELKDIKIKTEKRTDASPVEDSVPRHKNISPVIVSLTGSSKILNDPSPVIDPIPECKNLSGESPLRKYLPSTPGTPGCSKNVNASDDSFDENYGKSKYPKLSNSPILCKKSEVTLKEDTVNNMRVYKSPIPSRSPDDPVDRDWTPNSSRKEKNEWACMKSPPIYNFENKSSRLNQLKSPSRAQKSPRLNLATKLDFANEVSPQKSKEKYLASTLSPSHGNSQSSVYEVEKIVEHRELGPERFLYLVKWKGFDDTQCTWEPLENLTGCIEVVYQYKLKHMSKLASPVNQRYHKLKTYLSQHTDELLDIFVQRFRNDRGELCIPEVDVQEINGYIRSFARHPQLIKKNRAELDYLREQLLTSILHQKRLIQLEHLRSYEIEINVTAGNMVAPIYVINNVDLSVVPSNFQHTSLNIPTEGVVVNEEPIIWCECADNCRDSAFCCGQLNDSVMAYDSSKRLVIRQGTPIYECNKNCKCNASCPNRVIQLGTQVKLAIYKTYNDCGWGVQTLEQIPKGTFVTEYVGELLTFEAASRRENQTYLFNLDFNGSTSFVIDACNYGNISHFINHSCDPNLAVFPAYIQCLDPNLHRLPLFAIKDIKKGEQLSFSYYKSVSKTGSRKVKCKCDSDTCRGFLSVEGSTL